MNKPVTLVHMGDNVMEHRVKPEDKVSVRIDQCYHGPFAGDGSGKVHIIVNGIEIIRVAGIIKEIKTL